jgi:hypothetical protein
MATHNNNEHGHLSKELGSGAGVDDLPIAIDSLMSDLDFPMDNNWEYMHGRVDPGVDESIHLVEGITVEQPKGKARQQYDFQLPSNYERGESSSAAAQFDTLHGMLPHFSIYSGIPVLPSPVIC